MSERRDTRMSKRRAEILSAAAEQFAVKGYAGTTVRDIADSVGILSGSLYHHFSAKEEMVEEIFTAYFDELTDRWERILQEPWDTPTQFEAMLRAALESVDLHTGAARLFTHEWLNLRHLGDLVERWDAIEEMWMGVIRKGVAEGSFRNDIEPVLLFIMAMDVIRGLAGWYYQGSRRPFAVVSEAYLGVLMMGIVGDEGTTRAHAAAAGRH